MRVETGKALLATSPQLHRGPALSSLVGRVVAAHDLAAVPAPSQPTAVPAAPAAASSLAGLVTPPPPGRCALVVRHAPAGISLLGAHGGAGVSSLLRAGLDEIAVDADRCWPEAGSVVLVARTSTSGLEWARDLARQHASGLGGGDRVELLGLVLVADAPGRLPGRIAGLQDLVSGAFARTWRLPWLEEWRLAAANEPLPVHPDVQALAGELARTPQLSHPQMSRTTRTRGDLL